MVADKDSPRKTSVGLTEPVNSPMVADSELSHRLVATALALRLSGGRPIGPSNSELPLPSAPLSCLCHLLIEQPSAPRSLVLGVEAVIE